MLPTTPKAALKAPAKGTEEWLGGGGLRGCGEGEALPVFVWIKKEEIFLS